MPAFTERAAGERLFVDYARHTVDVIDPTTGEVRTAQLFVATLGASSYTFAEATWTQSLPDWIASHVRAFGFFGGVTAQIVSDNLKAGVTKACFYDPAINRTYGDLAAHYDTAFASGLEPVALPLVHCLRVRTNPKIKQRSRAQFCWLSAGCRAGSARIGSEAHLRCDGPIAQSAVFRPWGGERGDPPASGAA